MLKKPSNEPKSEKYSRAKIPPLLLQRLSASYRKQVLSIFFPLRLAKPAIRFTEKLLFHTEADLFSLKKFNNCILYLVWLALSHDNSC